MTASVTAGDRNTVTYANDTDRSLVNSVTDAKGVATGYSYDSMRRLLATACGDAAVTNGYTDDLLSSLSHTNTSGKTTTYSFVYGAADLQTAVNIGSRNLVSNAYNSGTWTLSSQTYGNGDYWKYFYDNMDTLTSRFTNCSDTEGIGFYYTYNGKGKLVRIEMKSVTIADGAVTGGTLLSSENYLYDGSDRLIRVVETDGDNVVLHDFSWTYDAKDNVTALTESIGGKSFSYTYAYDDDSRPTSFGYGDVTKQITYDGHGRSSGTTVKNGSRTVLGTGYAYRDVDSTYTTTQVKSVTNSYGGKTANFNYTYDANGNILSVSGDQTAVYEYDDLGQLITETIGTGYDQVIIRYTYDNGGNLIKKVREYTTEAPEPAPEPEPEPTPVPEPEPEPEPDPTPTPTPTPEPTPKPSREPIPINPPVTPTPALMSLDDSDAAVNSSDRVTVQEETLYTYGDAEWGDLLTAYNGEEITYDGIGNPLSYRGWTMSWQGGRQLASMTKGSDTLSFAYNESGLRTSKTVNGVTHNYVWHGSKLAADITDAYALYFHYDSSGEVIGFTRTASGADAEYFYVKNLQGDILKVITATGTEAATYTYDAWGRVLTSTGDLADINPLRYRGYYYDVETGLYYLQSRYYDPETSRFINSDVYSDSSAGMLAYNLFLYCANNPVSGYDSNGTWNWGKFFDGASMISIGVTAVAVAVTVLSCGAAAPVMVAVAAATATAGTLTAMNGAAEVVEAGTGYNVVRDGVFGGDDEAYEIYKTTTQTIAEVGTVMCGAYYSAKGANVCFIAGTLIATADGQTPIEDISPGDLVWAWDEETGNTSLKPVVETYINETDELIHLTVNGEEIVSTPTHPFYSPVKGWTAACRLRAGDILVLVNGDYVVLEKVQHELLESPIRVYNFQVTDYHTYFVGSISILVHNRCKQQLVAGNKDGWNARVSVGGMNDHNPPHAHIYYKNNKLASITETGDFLAESFGKLKGGNSFIKKNLPEIAKGIAEWWVNYELY